MKNTSPKATGIVLTALMVFITITVILIAANIQRKKSAQEADEIVFEPVEVVLDEGSAKLKVEYEAQDYYGFESNCVEEINIKIVKDDDNPNQFIVNGSLISTQRVDMGALDMGELCWFYILHNVKYSVMGTFTPSACKFELFVGMKPTDSTLIGHNCSIDLAFDPSPLYMAPPPEKLVFTKSFAGPPSSSLDYTLFLFDVVFPGGVNCPAFSN